MNYLLSCHNCGEVIVKDSGSEAKIRGRVLLIKGQVTTSVCPRCNTEVEVPLRLDPDAMKALRNSPRLFIRKSLNKH